MNDTSVLFNRRSDAELLQKRLSEAGVNAKVRDSHPLHGALLDVPNHQFDVAHRLLLGWHAADGALRNAIRCPDCTSLRIGYPQYTRKSTVPNLLIGLLANIGAMRKEFYCYDCHFTWPKEGTKPSRTRPNMAPYYFIEGIAQAQPHQPQQPQHA